MREEVVLKGTSYKELEELINKRLGEPGVVMVGSPVFACHYDGHKEEHEAIIVLEKTTELE